MDKSLVFSSICFGNIKKSSFNPPMLATISGFDRSLLQFDDLTSLIDIRLLCSLLPSASRNQGCVVCLVETEGSGSCKSLVVPGFFCAKSTNLSHRNTIGALKTQGLLFLVIPINDYITLELLKCLVFPPGACHFPCCFKTFSRKFFSHSRSFVHNSLSPVTRR